MTVPARRLCSGLSMAVGCVLGVAAPGIAGAAALSWPAELPDRAAPSGVRYVVPESNVVLDFHGSVQKPDLVIFMAGNQYRVLPELIAAFRDWAKLQPGYADLGVDDIFYATTPPGRLIDAMASGRISLGNLSIDVTPATLWPDVFMTGSRQLQRLHRMGQVDEYFPYVRNRGVVLLVKAGNPKRIQGVADLARDDVRVAISSPQREPASFENYAAALNGIGGAGLVDRVLAKPGTVSPQVVHHRENPQLVADGSVDVAPMLWHLADHLRRSFPDRFDYVRLPQEGNSYATMEMAAVKTSTRPRAARAWLDFMRSDAAAEIYTRHGFDVAPPADRARAVRLP